MELALLILGLYFCAPVVLAIVALVQVKGLRRKVEDLERFSARSELRSPRLFPSLAPAETPPLMPVETGAVVAAVAAAPTRNLRPAVSPAPVPVRPQPAAVWPAPAPRAPVPSAVEPAVAGNDMPLENVIGERILPRIGVVAIVLGLALLVWYAWGRFGEEGKIALTASTGLAMVIGGVILRRGAFTQLLGNCLVGGGWAVLYITAYAAHSIPASRIIESPLLGFLVLLAVAEAALIHALRYRSETVAGLAYLLTISTLLISPAPLDPLAAWAAIGLSGAILLAVALKEKWIRLCVFGALLLYVAEAVWLSRTVTQPESILIALGVLCLLWILWTLPSYFLKPKTDGDRRFHGLLVAVNSIGLLVAAALVQRWFHLEHMGWVWMTLGFLNVLSAFVGRKAAWRPAHLASLGFGAILLATGFHHLLTGLGPVFAWLGLSAALFGWGVLRKDEAARLMGMAALAATAVRLWAGEWKLEHGWIPGVLIPAGFYAASAVIAGLRRVARAGSLETHVTVALSHLAALSLALVLWNHPPELMSAMLFAIAGLGLVMVGRRLEAGGLAAEGVCYLAVAGFFFAVENLGASGEFLGVSRRLAAALPVLAAWLIARVVLPKSEADGENLGRFFGVLFFAGVLSLLACELGESRTPAAWAIACAVWYLWSRGSDRDFEFVLAALGSVATVLAFASTSHLQLPFLAHTGAVPTGLLIVAVFVAIHVTGSRLSQGVLAAAARNTFAVAMAVAGFLLIDREMEGTLLTGSWALLGFLLAGYGFWMRDRVSRWSSLVILGICTGKIALFDLANFEMPVKIATLLTLGGVMVALSWVYARHHRRIGAYLAAKE